MCSFPQICANPNFFIHEEQNSILTSLRSAHDKNKNYRHYTIDLLLTPWCLHQE